MDEKSLKPKNEEQVKLESKHISSNGMDVTKRIGNGVPSTAVGSVQPAESSNPQKTVVTSLNGTARESQNGSGPAGSSPSPEELPSTSCDKKSDLGKIGDRQSAKANPDETATAVHITNAVVAEAVLKTEKLVSSKTDETDISKCKPPEKPQRTSLDFKPKRGEEGTSPSHEVNLHANGVEEKRTPIEPVETSKVCDKELSAKEARASCEEKDSEYGGVSSTRDDDKKGLKNNLSARELQEKDVTIEKSHEGGKSEKTNSLDANSKHTAEMEKSGSPERDKTPEAKSAQSGYPDDPVPNKSIGAKHEPSVQAKTETKDKPVFIETEKPLEKLSHKAVEPEAPKATSENESSLKSTLTKEPHIEVSNSISEAASDNSVKPSNAPDKSCITPSPSSKELIETPTKSSSTITKNDSDISSVSITSSSDSVLQSQLNTAPQKETDLKALSSSVPEITKAISKQDDIKPPALKSKDESKDSSDTFLQKSEVSTSTSIGESDKSIIESFPTPLESSKFSVNSSLTGNESEPSNPKPESEKPVPNSTSVIQADVSPLPAQTSEPHVEKANTHSLISEYLVEQPSNSGKTSETVVTTHSADIDTATAAPAATPSGSQETVSSKPSIGTESKVTSSSDISSTSESNVSEKASAKDTETSNETLSATSLPPEKSGNSIPLEVDTNKRVQDPISQLSNNSPEPPNTPSVKQEQDQKIPDNLSTVSPGIDKNKEPFDTKVEPSLSPAIEKSISETNKETSTNSKVIEEISKETVTPNKPPAEVKSADIASVTQINITEKTTEIKPGICNEKDGKIINVAISDKPSSTSTESNIDTDGISHLPSKPNKSLDSINPKENVPSPSSSPEPPKEIPIKTRSPEPPHQLGSKSEEVSFKEAIPPKSDPPNDQVLKPPITTELPVEKTHIAVKPQDKTSLETKDEPPEISKLPEPPKEQPSSTPPLSEIPNKPPLADKSVTLTDIPGSTSPVDKTSKDIVSDKRTDDIINSTESVSPNRAPDTQNGAASESSNLDSHLEQDHKHISSNEPSNISEVLKLSNSEEAKPNAASSTSPVQKDAVSNSSLSIDPTIELSRAMSKTPEPDEIIELPPNYQTTDIQPSPKDSLVDPQINKEPSEIIDLSQSQKEASEVSTNGATTKAEPESMLEVQDSNVIENRTEEKPVTISTPEITEIEDVTGVEVEEPSKANEANETSPLVSEKEVEEENTLSKVTETTDNSKEDASESKSIAADDEVVLEEKPEEETTIETKDEKRDTSETEDKDHVDDSEDGEGKPDLPEKAEEPSEETKSEVEQKSTDDQVNEAPLAEDQPSTEENNDAITEAVQEEEKDPSDKQADIQVEEAPEEKPEEGSELESKETDAEEKKDLEEPEAGDPSECATIAEPALHLKGVNAKAVSLDLSHSDEKKEDRKQESGSARSSPVKSRYRFSRERSPDKAQRGVPKTLYRKDRTSTPDSKKSEKPLSSPKKSSASGESSPKKSLTPKNGVPSPSKSGRTPSSDPGGKKIPPIKAPVGQVPPPNVKNVKSKIGSLDNIKYKPGGGDKKVMSKKLDWKVEPKVGSLENATHKPGGGEKKIQSVKLEFKEKAAPKVGSKDNVKHQPGGGNVKVSQSETAEKPSSAHRVETQKLEYKDKAASKVGSMDNVKHKPGGGNIQIKTDRLNFKERASPKIGSLAGSDMGSNHGSNTHSPIPVLSPTPNDANSIPPVSEESSLPAVNGDDKAVPASDNAGGDAVDVKTGAEEKPSVNVDPIVNANGNVDAGDQQPSAPELDPGKGEPKADAVVC